MDKTEFRRERNKLYEMLLASDEDITIEEFYHRYASAEFIAESERENKRRMDLRNRGIYE